MEETKALPDMSYTKLAGYAKSDLYIAPSGAIFNGRTKKLVMGMPIDGHVCYLIKTAAGIDCRIADVLKALTFGTDVPKIDMDTHPVVCASEDGFFKLFASKVAAAKDMKLPYKDIVQCCSGKQKKIGKYYFFNTSKEDAYVFVNKDA